MGWFCCGKKKKVKMITGSEDVIDCPRCGVPMIHKSKLGVTVDKCLKCDGLWLDGGEIEKILLRVQEEQNIYNKKNKGVVKDEKRKK